MSWAEARKIVDDLTNVFKKGEQLSDSKNKLSIIKTVSGNNTIFNITNSGGYIRYLMLNASPTYNQSGFIKVEIDGRVFAQITVNSDSSTRPNCYLYIINDDLLYNSSSMFDLGSSISLSSSITSKNNVSLDDFPLIVNGGTNETVRTCHYRMGYGIRFNTSLKITTSTYYTGDCTIGYRLD